MGSSGICAAYNHCLFDKTQTRTEGFHAHVLPIFVLLILKRTMTKAVEKSMLNMTYFFEKKHETEVL